MTRTLRAGRERRVRALRRSVGVLAALAVLAAGGCSGGDESPSAQRPASSSPSLADPSPAPTLEVEPVVKSGTIVGRFPRKDRTRVEKRVARIAVRYVQAAYLGGDYPRKDFRDAFPRFTQGAAQAARRDRRLLTNKVIGPRIDDVTPTGVEVKVDLLAVGQRAVAATNHVTVRFRTAGKVERRFWVQGRLLMTKQSGRWKIFGYDLSKGAR